MATRYWLGGAATVAQVDTGSIDSVDATPANNTFTVTIGGIAISEVGDTDVATTATNLRATLNASTHPYFAAITWSGTSGDIIGTADTAGVPFTAALTETGAGTGTVTDFAATTANGSPHDFSNADNWDSQTAPGNSDTVIFADNDVNCCWGLDQSAISSITLYVDQSYTGLLGLDRRSFAEGIDGGSLNTAAPEYRDHRLSLDASIIIIGRNQTGTAQTGSSRIKIDNTRASSSTFLVEGTGTSTGQPCVMYTAAHGFALIEVRDAPGGVGLATDVPGETATLGAIDLSGSNPATTVALGEGASPGDLHVNEGELHVRSDAATINNLDVYGGEVYLNGDGYTIGTLDLFGGTVFLSGDVDITTLNMEGGDLDASKSSVARTITTVNFNASGELTVGDNLTITTFNEPSTGTMSVEV